MVRAVYVWFHCRAISRVNMPASACQLCGTRSLHSVCVCGFTAEACMHLSVNMRQSCGIRVPWLCGTRSLHLVRTVYVWFHCRASQPVQCKHVAVMWDKHACRSLELARVTSLHSIGRISMYRTCTSAMADALCLRCVHGRLRETTGVPQGLGSSSATSAKGETTCDVGLAVHRSAKHVCSLGHGMERPSCLWEGKQPTTPNEFSRSPNLITRHLYNRLLH